MLRLAHQLQKEKIAQGFVAIIDKNSYEYSAMVKELRFRMGSMVKEKRERNHRLEEAFRLAIEARKLKNAWGLIVN